MQAFTQEEFVAKVEELAIIYPDRISEKFGTDGSCRYFDDDRNPSCIMGHALHAFGVGQGTHVVTEGVSIKAVLPNFTEMDEPTRNYLNELQTHQDEGLPWGEAMQVAKAYYPIG